MLMKSILICPSERLDVPLLSVGTPLAVAPALGHGLVEYWMSHLACSGVKEVVLLAHDRPDAVRNIVGAGSRWGVAAEVITESQELTQKEALEKYGAEATLMDHFPGLPELPLFESYEHWFKALEAWMPRANTPDRVGMRELRPGIWVGLHAHISRDAQLCPPCWLGDHTYVGSGAVIGPRTVLENGAFVEAKAEIKNSVISPSTFVGQYLQIANSLVWGNTLVDWQTGLESKVPDAFLLCALNVRHPGVKGIPLLDRVAEWLTRWTEEPPMEAQPLLMEPQPILIKEEAQSRVLRS
jgi:hypothetical protein